MKRVVLLLLIAMALGACDSSRSSSVRGAASIAAPEMDALTVAKSIRGDCLQYVVERRPDGTEVWNADYVYFYLVREDDGSLAQDARGKAVASGLLASQALQLMGSMEEVPGTAWTWRVMRCAQEVRDGKVTRTSEFAVVDDADLRDLLDRDARARREATSPERPRTDVGS